jgi:hypothetical protein
MDRMDTEVHDTEQALVKWTERCAAHPDKCSLAARGNNTAVGVHKAITQALAVAYQTYDGTKWDGLLDRSNSTIMSNPRRWTYVAVASQIFAGLYDERFGSIISDIIDGIIVEQSSINGTVSPQKRTSTSSISFERSAPFIPFAWPGSAVYPPSTLTMAIHAIACGDTIDSQGRTTQQLFEKIINISQSVSPNFGSMLLQQDFSVFCHRWTSRAVERLPKKMNTKPKNVVLVIGNSDDPITPYVSAKSLASSVHLGNKARLVKHNTLGHSTRE